MPNVFIRSTNFSTLLSLPVISMERLFGCTSTILARKMSVICITSARDLESTATFMSTSSRSTHSPSWKSCTSMTFGSLLSCLTICSSVASSPCVTMVMRDVLGSCVGPTLSVSML